MRSALPILMSAAMALPACAPKSVTADASAEAMVTPLIDASGASIGEVMMMPSDNGLTLRVTARGLSAGPHGVHLHEKGLCEGPKFVSAGGHWNPAGKQHGKHNAMGAHLGDLDNLNGGVAIYVVAGVSAGGEANTIADSDGTSLVIHAKADDYLTDPSGNSGDRIACAVLAPAAS